MENDKMLAFGNISQADFGQLLIDEATNRERRRQLDMAATEVSRLLEGIDKLTIEMRTNQSTIDKYNTRLDALRSGTFKLKDGKIVYQNDALNQPPF